ncbi:hypothetical protein ACFQ51_56230 [Streptomyces kaempferi]
MVVELAAREAEGPLQQDAGGRLLPVEFVEFVAPVLDRVVAGHESSPRRSTAGVG